MKNSRGIATLLALIFILSLFLLSPSVYAGSFKEIKQMIMGKEYRIENAIKDGKEGCWVYWGEDKVWWEPKPWQQKLLKEEGLAFYDRWIKPGLPYPYELSLEERGKLSGFEVVDRATPATVFGDFRTDSITAWTPQTFSPRGKVRVKKGMEFLKSNRLNYKDFNLEKFRAEGKLRRKYSYFMTYPEDVKGMGGIMYSYYGPKEDDIWFYLPSVRKVRRMSVGSRQDFFPGSVCRNEDVSLLKQIHNYRILRTEIFKDPGPESWGFGNHPSEMEIERCGGIGTPCYVVECTPCEKDWWFAKQIKWVDIKSNYMYFEYSYDQTGQLIRSFTTAMALPFPEKFPWMPNWQFWGAYDYTTGYKSTIPMTECYFETGFPESVFATGVLLKEPGTLFFWR